MLASEYRKRIFQGELRVSGAANCAQKQQNSRPINLFEVMVLWAMRKISII